MAERGWLHAPPEMGESLPVMRCQIQRIVNVNVAEIGGPICRSSQARNVRKLTGSDSLYFRVGCVNGPTTKRDIV